MVKRSIAQSKRVSNLNGVNKYLYDLIVLDMNMPVMDGMEACKAILSELNNSKALKNGLNLTGKRFESIYSKNLNYSHKIGR